MSEMAGCMYNFVAIMTWFVSTIEPCTFARDTIQYLSGNKMN